jgi:hypothetical protein
MARNTDTWPASHCCVHTLPTNPTSYKHCERTAQVSSTEPSRHKQFNIKCRLADRRIAQYLYNNVHQTAWYWKHHNPQKQTIWKWKKVNNHHLLSSRMPFSSMCCCADLVWTDVSEEHTASIFRVEKSTSEELVWADGWSLQMEAIRSSEVLVHTRSTQGNIPEDSILYRHHFENLKSYNLLSYLKNVLVFTYH